MNRGWRAVYPDHLRYMVIEAYYHGECYRRYPRANGTKYGWYPNFAVSMFCGGFRGGVQSGCHVSDFKSEISNHLSSSATRIRRSDSRVPRIPHPQLSLMEDLFFRTRETPEAQP